jgi:hypothetical protein
VAKRILKPLDLQRHGRLLPHEALRRTGEIALLRDHCECAQQVDIEINEAFRHWSLPSFSVTMMDTTIINFHKGYYEAIEPRQIAFRTAT